MSKVIDQIVSTLKSKDCCPLGAVLVGRARLQRKNTKKADRYPCSVDVTKIPGLKGHAKWLQKVIRNWDGSNPIIDGGKGRRRSVNMVANHPVTSGYFFAGVEALGR